MYEVLVKGKVTEEREDVFEEDAWGREVGELS